jgi:antitoxin component of MazEF toxin-antitoxin module
MKTEKRKLIKFGNYSLCITLPKDIVSEMKLKKGDVINLQVDEQKGKIIIDLEKTKVTKSKTSETQKAAVKTRW